MTKHYFKLTKTIINKPRGVYSKGTLLFCYSKLIYKSYIFQKFRSPKKSTFNKVLREKILGYTIQFYNYPELINLFEEIYIFETYKPSYPKPETIIDCGGNIGLTILYYKQYFPACRVLAFEPDTSNFSLLKQNLTSNNIKGVAFFNTALSDQEREMILYKNIESSNSLTSRLIKTPYFEESEIVFTEKLSDHINGAISILKIDVEGSEVSIINNLIHSQKLMLIKEMIIEFHPDIIGLSVDDFINKIIPYGFTCRSVQDMLHPGGTEIMIYCTNTSSEIVLN